MMIPAVRQQAVWVSAGIAVYVLLLGNFAMSPSLATMGDDSSSYLILARYLAHPVFPDPAAASIAEYDRHYPMFFPFILAITGAAWNLVWAHWLVVLLTGSMLALTYRHACQRMPQLAWIPPVLLMSCPGLVIHSLGILSEPLFGCLLLLLAMRHVGWSGGLLLALAITTRVTGLAAFPAAIIAFWAQPRRQTSAAFKMIGTAIFLTALLWIIKPSAAAPDAYNHGLMAMIQPLLDGGIEAVIARSTLYLRALDAGWCTLWVGQSASVSLNICARILGLAALIGWGLAMRKKQFEAWFSLFYLAALWLWIVPDEMPRFLIPILPLTAIWMIESFQCLPLKQVQAKRGILYGALLIIFSLAGIQYVGFAIRSQQSAGLGTLKINQIRELYEIRDPDLAIISAGKHLAHLAAFTDLPKITAPDARVMWVRPSYVTLLGDRQGVPALYGSIDSLKQQIVKNRVSHYLLTTFSKTDIHWQLGASPSVADFDPFSTVVAIYRNPVNQQIEAVLFQINQNKLQLHPNSTM